MHLPAKTEDVIVSKFWISCIVEQFIVGFIRGPHGIKGNIKVESASGEFDHFYEMKEVTLRNGKTGDSKVFKIESIDEGAATLYMKLEGLETPEEVRKYNGWELIVPRKYAKKLEKDEWYIEDLKNCALNYYPEQSKDGLAVRSAPTTGKAVRVGTITDVLEGGSGDLLEVCLAEDCDILADNIKYTSGGKLRVVYIPFSFQFVRNVDIKNKSVQLMHLWILE